MKRWDINWVVVHHDATGKPNVDQMRHLRELLQQGWEPNGAPTATSSFSFTHWLRRYEEV